MRVRGDLHTNTIWAAGVGTLLSFSTAWSKGFVRCDVCKQLDYKAMSAIVEFYFFIISCLARSKHNILAFFRPALAFTTVSLGSSFWRIFSPFQSQAKGVMHLFVSIKLKLKHKRRELKDQIAALGRTTGSFCRHTTQMTQCLSSVPMCNWRLWISYGTYFTYHFPAFFCLYMHCCASHCIAIGWIIFFIICSSGD